MKHSLRVTGMLIGIFILAQLAGLAVIAEYLDVAALQRGEIGWQRLPLGFERPDIAESTSYLYLLGAMLIGTVLVLLLIRFRAVRSWKAWFALAVLLCLTISFSAWLPQGIALALATLFALWRTFWPNRIVHNATEIFLYGGIAAMFVPVLNLASASILLVLVSLYDAIAVWHSKHMVNMAKFQSNAKMFAGVFIPYGKDVVPSVRKRHAHAAPAVAVLGGGDIAFPLLFSGAVLKWLLSTHALGIAFALTAVVTVGVTIALTWLLLAAKPKKFYPAMPFLSAGCFAALGLLWVIT